MDVSVSKRSHLTARLVGPRARSALKLQHLAHNLPSMRAALRTLVLAVALCAIASQVIGAPISIQCPADITANASSGNCSGAVSFAATATPASGCILLGIAYGIGSTQITSPHTFPLGTTTVQAGAADSCGNFATCTFHVTVVDRQPPTITCPANKTVNADSSRCTASVSFAAAASDNCSVASLTYHMGAGGMPISSPYDFPVGTTSVAAWARDPSGNAWMCTFSVTVRDTQPPGVICSPDATVSNDPGRCDASVTMRSLGSDNCPLASLRYYLGQTQISNPHAFALGSTDVRTEVRDPSGNFSSCTFRVRVNDTEPPSITCPADMEAAAQSGQYSASLAFSAAASDNCRLASLGYFIGYTGTTLISSPYSFPVGETTVRAEARDASDNMASCAFRVTVRDTQPGNITGKVTNSSGAAFPGVSLSVFDQNYCYKAFAFNINTIADGTYAIPNVPAGTYKVRFFPPHGSPFLDQWYQNKKDFDAALPVSVTAGQTTPNIDAQLIEGGKITGKVTNPAGQGLANVSVWVSGDRFFSASTDANGDYVIQKIPSGNYEVGFRPPNSINYQNEYFNDKPDSNSADAVLVNEGQTTSQIDAQLAEGGQISGKVTNPAGQELAGVSVRASDDKSNSRNASTNSNGDYLLQGMPAGSYQIKFDAGNQNFAIEWYNDKSSLNLADPVQVTLGTPTTGIDAQLAVGGKICGMVTTPVGADLQALVAKAYDMNNTDVGYTFVNKNNGDFCIQGLPGGSYKIQFRDIHEHTQVQCGETVLAQAWYDQKTTFEQADPVQVTVDTTPNINTQLYFGGAISGKTTIPSSASLKNVHVWVYDSNQQRVIDGRSGTDGKYQIDGIPAGSYRVLFDPTAPFGPIWYQQKNAFGLADPVSVTASALTPNIDGQCWYQLFLPLLSNN